MILSANLYISDFSIFNKKITLIKILKGRDPRIDLWQIPLIALAQSLHEDPGVFFFVSENVSSH